MLFAYPNCNGKHTPIRIPTIEPRISSEYNHPTKTDGFKKLLIMNPAGKNKPNTIPIGIKRRENNAALK